MLPSGRTFAFLEHAVELHLHGEAHISDLVHEKRSAIGSLKEAAAILAGAGEGTLHVAEQLGFEERLGECAAIDGDEGLFGARAILVDGARDEFFSRAAFAGDEHAAGLWRDGLNQVEDLAHLRAGADDVVEARKAADLAPENAGLFLQFDVLGNLCDRLAQFIDESVAFDDVAVGAEIDGIDGRGERGNAGNQDEDGLRRNFAGKAEQVHTAHVAHIDIGDDDVEKLSFQAALSLLAAGSQLHTMSVFSKGDFEELADGSFVVNHQNVSHGLSPASRLRWPVRTQFVARNWACDARDPFSEAQS